MNQNTEQNMTEKLKTSVRPGSKAVQDSSWERIHSIFYPRSIAVIGANRVKGSVPYDIFNNLLRDGFQGTLFPVSPRESSIKSVKAYKYVIDIPDPVDMGILVFPASVSELAMEQCGQKGIRSMIVISAGFREAGGKGIEREQRLKAQAAQYGISFIGPNCLGVINTDPEVSFNASFSRAMPDEGDIAFLSQSGALCTAVLDYARAKHIGFSKFVSFGNKADVDEVDLLLYLKDDPKTKVILLYLEEVTNGRRLMQAARQVITETGKPVLILKSGRSAEGASAAASHTGSMAGSDAVCDAAFRQAGIIRCDNIEQMFNFAVALSWQPLPPGRRTAVITNAGGPGVLATDRAVQAGMTMASFSEITVKALKKSQPASANIKNPVDIIGDARADRYTAALQAVTADPEVDCTGVILTPQSMTEIEDIAREVSRFAADSGKCIYASFMGETDVAPGIQILQKNRIPHYILPEDMVDSMAAAARFREIREGLKKEVLSPGPALNTTLNEHVQHLISSGRSALTEAESMELLASAGFPLPKRLFIPHGSPLPEDLGELCFPLAAKVMSPQIMHKSDAGAVRLNIQNREDLIPVMKELLSNAGKYAPDAEIHGILLQNMVPQGIECILGIKRDPAFGPVIMVGAGGLYAEFLKDSSLGVAALSMDQAQKMISSLKIYELLQGRRGHEGYDLPALTDALMRLSELSLFEPGIAELDINPLIVHPRGRGVTAADAAIVLRKI